MTADFIVEAGQFREPGEFAKVIERHRGGMTKDEIYRKPGNQELKDAWQGVMFALGYQENHRVLTEVRICAPENFPDFQIRINSKVFDFEATIVLEEGRRLGDDYRGDKSQGPALKEKPEDLPPFDSALLRQAIARKAGKRYAAKPHLAVYLNIKGRDVLLGDLAAVAAGREGKPFASIWIITDHYIGCVKKSHDLPAKPRWLKIPIK